MWFTIGFFVGALVTSFAVKLGAEMLLRRMNAKEGTPSTSNNSSSHAILPTAEWTIVLNKDMSPKFMMCGRAIYDCFVSTFPKAERHA